MANVSDDDQPVQNQDGFSVHKADRSVTDALEDFERYRDKKAWEKAFGALNKTLDSKVDGLVPDKDGLFISASAKIRQELLTLGPEGRQAYRLFYDPKAEQLLNAAVNSSADSSGGKLPANSPAPDSTDKLREIVDRYFVTSVGDRAADRLGDALFEAGDFAGAESAWREILDSYPDTSLSPALLQTKCAIALARAGEWEKFASAKAVVAERYAGQTVRLGGRDVVASEYLDGLAPDAGATAPATTQAAGTQAAAALPSTLIGDADTDPPASLPSADTPVWQVPLITDAMRAQLQQNGGFAAPSDPIPATAVDDRRVYIDWFGIYFAVDLHTGKLLWRSESFANLSQKINARFQNRLGVSAGSVAVVPMGTNVLFTGMDNSGAGPQGVGLSRLVCLTADHGKTVWSSERGRLSDWNFVGAPILTASGMYACAYPSSNADLHLLCIAPANGELLWETTLGTPAQVGNPYGGPAQIPIPVLLEHQGMLYALTNNGAVIAVDPPLRQVAWAFKYAMPDFPTQQRFFFNGMAEGNTSPAPPGAMLAEGSTLYLKENSGSRLYAFDLAGPHLKWSRPVESSVTLAAARGEQLFLVGDEVDCIDADSRAMLWSDKLSPSTDSLRPLLAGDRFYVFDSRGVHGIHADTGDADPIFRGYDRDGSGGILWQSDGLLVTVSAVAITGYRLPTARR